MARATRRCCAVIIATILCIRMVWAAEPRGEAIDHRAAVDATTYPWSAVGALFNGGRSECTAVAVAPGQALTAAHCLFGQATGQLMQPRSLHLLLGFVRGTYRVDALVQSYQFGAGYDHGRPYDTLDADWALLKLTVPLPAGHPTLPLANALPNTPVMTGGYGKDRAFMMTMDGRCRVRQVMGQGLLSSLYAHVCGGSSTAVSTPCNRQSIASALRENPTPVADLRPCRSADRSESASL
jgi:protease YdgD